MTTNTPKPRGGKRAGAGRKPLADNQRKHTVSIRIDASLIPTIEQLKSGDLIHCTDNQTTELTAQIAKLKAQVAQLERARENSRANCDSALKHREKRIMRLEGDLIAAQAETRRAKEDAKAAMKELKAALKKAGTTGRSKA